MVEVAALVGDLAMPRSHCLARCPRLFEPRFFSASRFWAVASRVADVRAQRGLGSRSPSEVVAKFAMPTSTPIWRPVEGNGVRAR